MIYARRFSSAIAKRRGGGGFLTRRSGIAAIDTTSRGFSSTRAPSDESREIEALREIEKKVNWLATYTIHHANNIRPKRDGLKVGGHQASSASLVTILTALYTKVLRPQDRVAVKPHAGPVYHALQYLLGRQTKEQLQKFRALGGVQSYPSRTKDKCQVDFSTGSVGLGATATSFAAYVETFLRLKGLEPPAFPGCTEPPKDQGRMIALVGDAELDEGTVAEGLLESWKLDIRNNWWIIDYNRQSLDKIMEEKSYRLIDRMFRTNGWDVVTIKYGKQMRDAFEKPGGKLLRKWINQCDNSKYSALTFAGGKMFRQEITAWCDQAAGTAPDGSGDDDAERQHLKQLLASYNDVQLHGVMTNLGGHCFETVLEAFDRAAESDRRTAFIFYTVKGYGLPSIAGHRDNHGLFMQAKQIEEHREELGIPENEEWDKMSGIHDVEGVRALLDTSPFNAPASREYSVPKVDIPEDLAPNVGGASAKPVSTQAAFGAIMLEISKYENDDFSNRILTAAPDVATTTNLGGFVNKRGIFSPESKKDAFRDNKGVFSMNNWRQSPDGQHVELGIAENNLMILLAAAGLSAELFGQRLFPIGTLYDPFIARGLDSLNYGTYMNSRFMLVGTPSGLTLGPEGGAHQSISSPLISMATPNMRMYEPAFADELKALMRFSFEHMQADDGGSVYLRLSTRPVAQIDRETSLIDDPETTRDIVDGCYYHVPPTDGTSVVVAFSGAIAPEALSAFETIRRERPQDSPALLQITSCDLLANEWKSRGDESHANSMLKRVPRDATIVTVVDAHPTSLSWIGSCCGHRVVPLGVQDYGQSGDLVDLYGHYGLDEAAIVDAAGRCS
eukprot:g1018.t1